MKRIFNYAYTAVFGAVIITTLSACSSVPSLDIPNGNYREPINKVVKAKVSPVADKEYVNTDDKKIIGLQTSYEKRIAYLEKRLTELAQRNDAKPLPTVIPVAAAVAAPVVAIAAPVPVVPAVKPVLVPVPVPAVVALTAPVPAPVIAPVIAQTSVPLPAPVPVAIPVKTFAISSELTTLEVLHNWALKDGYRMIINGEPVNNDFPKSHKVLYVDLPLLPAHKGIQARSIAQGNDALSKIYDDAKVNLNGIVFSVDIQEKSNVIEVQAIQAKPSIQASAPAPVIAPKLPSPAVVSIPVALPVVAAAPVKPVAAAPIAPAMPVAELFSVTGKDQTLIALLTRWSQQAGFTTVINSETVDYRKFPMMATPAAQTAMEFPLASGAKGFKPQASFLDAVKVLSQTYVGNEQLPKDFVLSIDPASKVMSIKSPIKS